jgi:hypothetical protein
MQTFWNALAALGAVTGVLALGWQVFTWKRAQPHLVVKASNAFPTYGDRLGSHHFAITVTNHGGAATEVTGWGLRLPDDSSMVVPNPPNFSDKPGRIESHGHLTFFVEAAGVIERCKMGGLAASDLRPFVISSTAGTLYGNHLPWKDDE